MKRLFRIILMMAVLVGLVGLARNQVAWAANSAGTSDPSAPQWAEKSVSLGGDVDCSKPWNKNKDKCKDKDKDKDKCKKHKEDCGSVKPPPHQIIIPVTGDYSVGGFCTLSIALTEPAIVLDASIETPLPRELPDRVQKVRQGCHLIYYDSAQRINELPVDSGSATICFAATPNKQMTVYFFNMYASHPTWVPLETTVEAGKACATGNASGIYVATFQKP